MSTFVVSVLTHTPSWVWGLLAALMTLGLLQARDQTVSPRRVLIQPLALGALSIWSASSAFGMLAAVQPMWLLGMLLGMAVNRGLGLPRRVRVLSDGRYTIGGSWAPLALMLAIFALRYVVAASLAIMPLLASDAAFAAVASLLYGVPAGLLAARALRILGLARALPSTAAA